jgi:dTDP-4-amino-4,6-dideoxygalactose transaminase
MAAIGLVALKYVEEDNRRRREICGLYDELLADDPCITRIPITEGCVPSRHLYQVLIDRRDEVVGQLQAARIYPGVHYRDNTVYGMYQNAAGSCPTATRASDRLLSLPLHLRLTDPDVRRVATELRAAVRRLTP